jgi:hypothetical protein
MLTLSQTTGKLIVTAEDLIQLLDEQIPHRCPTADMSEREIWMYVGSRKLIDDLKIRFEVNTSPT